MVAKQHFTRINTIEPKDLLYRRIGHQRAEKYFDLLHKLLTMKLKKPEFDKLCIRTIGKENTPLHNHLIQSILKNACHAKVPPPQNQNKKVNLVQSPRKSRSKFRDRPSPLGPLGKTPSGQETGPTELNSLGSRFEDGEEVEQGSACSHSFQSRSPPITAPFGVCLKVGRPRKPLSCTGSSLAGGSLPDTVTLRTHLERKLELEGINVSLDCARVLNHSLDVYMKRLIEPCIGLAKSRVSKQEKYQDFVYGSMLDFRVAMESNPRVLGGDWPVQLEKICCRGFEE
jgi:hypothetical protein